LNGKKAGDDGVQQRGETMAWGVHGASERV
jgi:hypothetical protein